MEPNKTYGNINVEDKMFGEIELKLPYIMITVFILQIYSINVTFSECLRSVIQC